MPNGRCFDFFKTKVPRMFVLTEQFGVPAFDFNVYRYAIGVWKNKHQEQSYFYCVSTSRHSRPLYSQISRFNLDGPVSDGCWETVGKVNFSCTNAAISPCGCFIWSMEIPRLQPQHLIFRQTNPETLEYEEHETSELDPNLADELQSARFQYTQLFGNFLLVQQRLEREHFVCGDLIFRFYMDKDRSRIQLERIQLPELPTVGPYRMCSIPTWWYKKSNFGLFEHDQSLFFYQIDYFGDLFVLEWSKFGPLEWIQFTVEGDQFESWMISSDRNLSTNRTNSTSQEMTFSTDQLVSNYRRYLPDNLLHCTHIFRDNSMNKDQFYHCDFQIERRVCRIKHLFSTCRPFRFDPKHMSLTKNRNGNVEFIFLGNNGKNQEECWERVAVNKVPALLHLTYLVVSQIIQTNEKLLETDSAICCAADSTDMQLSIKKGSVFGRCVQKVRRMFFKNRQNVSPTTERNPYNRPKPHNHESSVCPDQQTTVLPTISGLQVRSVLDEVRNKCI